MKKNIYFLLVPILILNFAGCNNKTDVAKMQAQINQSNKKIQELQKKIDSLEDSDEDCRIDVMELHQEIKYRDNYCYAQEGYVVDDERNVRAIGESDYGKILIKCPLSEDIKQFRTDTESAGKDSDYSIKGDYEVVFKSKSGKKTIIKTFKNLELVQPVDKIIKLQKLKFKDFDLFCFMPTYRNMPEDTGGNLVYFFAITNKGESFPFNAKHPNVKKLDDFLSILRESPIKVLNDNLVTIRYGFSEKEQRLDIYNFIFKPDLKNKTLNFVRKEFLERGYPR